MYILSFNTVPQYSEPVSMIQRQYCMVYIVDIVRILIIIIIIIILLCRAYGADYHLN